MIPPNYLQLQKSSRGEEGGDHGGGGSGGVHDGVPPKYDHILHLDGGTDLATCDSYHDKVHTVGGCRVTGVTSSPPAAAS